MDNWNADIEQLESFFKTTTIPQHSIKLDQCATITNVDTFIDSHMQIVKKNNGNTHFVSYLNRLKKIKNILQNE